MPVHRATRHLPPSAGATDRQPAEHHLEATASRTAHGTRDQRHQAAIGETPPGTNRLPDTDRLPGVPAQREYSPPMVLAPRGPAVAGQSHARRHSSAPGLRVGVPTDAPRRLPHSAQAQAVRARHRPAQRPTRSHSTTAPARARRSRSGCRGSRPPPRPTSTWVSASGACRIWLRFMWIGPVLAWLRGRAPGLRRRVLGAFGSSSCGSWPSSPGSAARLLGSRRRALATFSPGSGGSGPPSSVRRVTTWASAPDACRICRRLGRIGPIARLRGRVPGPRHRRRAQVHEPGPAGPLRPRLDPRGGGRCSRKPPHP